MSTSRISSVQQWIVTLFVRGIRACSTEQDRLALIAWMALAREIVADDRRSISQKASVLYRMMDFKGLATGFFHGIREAVRSYRTTDLPLSVKVAIPVTLAAATVVGGQGAGVVAFGSGIGVPVLLLLFLGTAGITAILEAVLSRSEASNYLTVVLALIARDAALLQARAWLREAMVAEIAEPKAQPMPEQAAAQRDRLLTMDPFLFERHVMSFFQQQGLLAWATQKTNDGGVDGFAKHREGLIVVQCKRYASDNLVDRPTVQQLKGVVEENAAFRGYLVTTSGFSQPAQECAALSDRIVLVDMEGLIGWHQGCDLPAA